MAARAHSSRMKRDWRDLQLEMRLIDAVRKRRPLWDNTTPLHKNVRVLMYCWQQVAREMGINGKLVKSKWKCLRDYFFRQVKELEKNGNKGIRTNANDKKYCLWPLYDRLTFLIGNNKKNIYFHGYKMTDEENKLLEEVAEHHDRQRNGLDTIVYHVPPSPPADSLENPITVFKNESGLVTTDQASQCQAPPYSIIASNSVQEKGIIRPETTNMVSLCEPPPLRVFKQATNVLKKKTDFLLTKVSAEQSQPAPPKRINPTPNPQASETPIDAEPDAELHFFRSLLPFMRAFPLEHKLRVRNKIQNLILGELEALKTRSNSIGTSSQAISSFDKDPVTAPTEDERNSTIEETHQSRPVIVKDEFEDDQTLLFEIHSKNVSFENDTLFCDDS